MFNQRQNAFLSIIYVPFMKSRYEYDLYIHLEIIMRKKIYGTFAFLNAEYLNFFGNWI